MISIIGCGHVGCVIAYTLGLHKLTNKILLYDIQKERLLGEVEDLKHCNFSGVEFVAEEELRVIAESQIIVITAGAKRTPNQTRLDLAEKNAKIVASIIDALNTYGSSAKLIILTNPVDIITYLAEKKYSSSSPKAKRIVFGLGTYIDTLRLKSRLKEKLGLKEEVYLPIIGEHGDSMVAVLSQAKIKGKSWPELPQSTKEIVLKAIKEVLSLGSYLIKSKGGANFGVAHAIYDIVMILLKKEEKKCLPISSSLGNTIYDLDNELAISLPVILSERGIEKVVKFELSEEENFKLKESAQIIKATLEKIKLN